MYSVRWQNATACRSFVWGNNLTLINKVKEDAEGVFYDSQTLEKGWSRDLLLDASNRLFLKPMPNTPMKYSEVLNSLGYSGLQSQ